MADALSSLIYVKNYRADRLRLHKKYSNSASKGSIENIWSSTSTLTGIGFDRPSSSLLRSNLTLHRNSTPAATLRSSSGYSSTTDFSSSWSPKVSLVSTVQLAGFGNQPPSLTSSYIDINGSRASSLLSVGNTSSSVGTGAGLHSSRAKTRPVIQYQRTLSGGTQFRSTSADPDYTNFRSPLSHLARQQAEPEWTNRSASVERHFDKSCTSLMSYVPSNSGGVLSSISSNLGLNNSYSSVVTSIEQTPSEKRTWITPVTELARNVSTYDWDKEKSVVSINEEAVGSISGSNMDVSKVSIPDLSNVSQTHDEKPELITLTQNGIEKVYSKKRNQNDISSLELEDELTLARVSYINAYIYLTRHLGYDSASCTLLIFKTVRQSFLFSNDFLKL